MLAAARNAGTESMSNSVIGHEAFQRLVSDKNIDIEVRVVDFIDTRQESRKKR